MKFKKHISLFLAFFMLVSNMGFAFSVHYCGNNIASISLQPTYLENNKVDDCCGIVPEKSNCCKDKVIKIQKKSDYAIVKVFTSQLQFDFVSQKFQIFSFELVQNFKKSPIPVYTSDAHAPPLFKLFNQYIFYDKV